MPQHGKDYIERQHVTAVSKSTRAWDRVDAQVRERAFFMAGVGDARRLAAFKRVAAAIANGEMSLAEGRRHVREALAASGYVPEEGEEGGLHDLRSRRRIDLTLQTNVDMARGWAARRQALEDITNPGQELYRMKDARVPRDWARRWQEAAQAVGMEGVAPDGSWRALVTSPIWVKLSRFGYAYPPFDFNSGMRVRPVSADTCRQLGLLEGEWMEEMDRQRNESLNQGMAVDVSDMDAETLGQLDEALGAVANVRGGVVEMADVNGTKPYSAAALGAMLREDLPGEIPNLQRAALELWDDGALPEEAEPVLQDLFHRLEPEKAPGDLYRVTQMTPEEMATMERAGYTPPAGEQAAAFSPRQATGKGNVVLKWQGARKARDIGALLKALGREPEKALHLLRGARLKVVAKAEGADGTITYTVQDA